MPFDVPIEEARKQFPQYDFVAALTPSEQKAAFHIRDQEGHELCLKIISPDSNVDRLHREIEALQSIDHPNVVRLQEYTFSSKPGQQLHYMIESYVDGTDLTTQLTRDCPWALERASLFFAQLCDGLKVLADLKVVHRDLKPANIRVRDDDIPVIIDFGLARHLALPDLTNTAQGAWIGTPAYFAPEQFEGTKRDIDHRTDLFALGVILYQAIVGRHPFLADDMTCNELRDAVCEGDSHLRATAFAELPRRWQILVAKLLSRDRAARPANAGTVATLLRKLGGD